MGVIELPELGSIYLDAVTVIYGVETHARYVGLIEPLWAASRAGNVELATSELSMLESLVMPLRQNDTALIDAYETLFSATELRRISVSASILRAAAEIRAETGLKTPNAIHAATAIGAGCDLFITNDPGFRKVADLPVVILNDLL